MSDYSSKDLVTALLQFFALDADEQLDYATGITPPTGETVFPFGLSQSPIIEMANACYNMPRTLADEEGASPTAIALLEELQSLIQLMLCQRMTDYGTAEALRKGVEWRLVRKLSRASLGELGIPVTRPSIPYEELIPLIMD